MKTRFLYLSLTLVLGLALTLGVLFLNPTGSPNTANAASASTIYHVAPSCNGVPTPCFTTVQAAVDAASDPGDVVKVATGTYTGVTIRNGMDQVLYISKTVTVRGGYSPDNWDVADPLMNPTTLDAAGLGRVMVITGSITPTVTGLHLTNGDATGLGGNYWGNADVGGGVYIHSATPTISDCMISSNIASTAAPGGGGGLYLLFSDATLLGNTVQENRASSFNPSLDSGGGGLFILFSEATLIDNKIISNTAGLFGSPIGGAGGGLMIHESTATVLNNTIKGNVADAVGEGRGGGAILSGGKLVLQGNLFHDNVASVAHHGYGGGLFVSEGGDITLTGNTIFSNTASQNAIATGKGGGVAVSHGFPITLTNNVIAQNQANTAGSGLWFSYVEPAAILHPSKNISAAASSSLWFKGLATYSVNRGTLLHTTLADNHGGSAGLSVEGNVALDLRNTIVAGHLGSGISATAGSTVTLQATLWDGNGTNFGGGGLVTSLGDVLGSPEFLDPVSGDYHLGPYSAARDAGLNAGVFSDIDGQSRPHGGFFDLGADEAYWWLTYLPLAVKSAP